MNEKIVEWITDYVKGYHELKDTETQWRTPIVGFASANDPSFHSLKQVVGNSHALPDDLIEGAQSVIVFFLPFAKDIVEGNIAEVQSSRPRDIANIETNQLILDINRFLHGQLAIMGHESTVLPATYNYDEKNLTSDWSHRHIAQIAGVGTFGIHNLLITEAGCCGRLGSVVTTASLDPTEKIKFDHCLYRLNGSCGKCLNLCVANAFYMDKGFPRINRKLCNAQIYDDNVPMYNIGMGDACGKCMCGIPCSVKSPVGRAARTSS